MKIGRLTISDRASAGIYEDRSGPEIQAALTEVFPGAHFESAIVPDEIPQISAALIALADQSHCDLIVTTGGTGISPRDVTPEATRAVLAKELPGFGEVMRMATFPKVKTAILSRATAGVRGASLLVNLPGKPSAVRECLEVLVPAMSEALRHLGGDNHH